MKLQIKHRDGPGRAGTVTLESKPVELPAIAWVHSSKFTAPSWADLILTSKKEEKTKQFIQVTGSFANSQPQQKNEYIIPRFLLYPKDCPSEVLIAADKQRDNNTKSTVLPSNNDALCDIIDAHPYSNLFILTNAGQFIHQQSSFISTIISARTRIGYHRLLMTPAIATPMNLSFLCYLGIDCVDSFTSIIAAHHHKLLFPTGEYNLDTLQKLPCSCPVCHCKNNDPSSMSQDDILHHNYYAMENELILIRTALQQGSLRELAETRVRSSPHLTSLLRILDEHYTFLEERTPLTRTSPLLATSATALTRPEIHRFQERVIKYYQKPKHKKILLLLPCSASKPYSLSPSHRTLLRALSTIPNEQVIHQMIITSPVGLVPRELELVYPASNYDISVTGHWDQNEQQMITFLLKQYLNNNSYDHVIVHLPKSLQEFLLPILPNATCTCDTSPTSEESLLKLTSCAKELAQQYPTVSKKQYYHDIIAAIAVYQFGSKAIDFIQPSISIRGKYPFLKVYKGKQQLAMLTMPRGLLSLTLEGGQYLLNQTSLKINIDDDFSLKGSLLTPGIINADSSIRIGDEVLLLRKQQLHAVGVAQMNGSEMSEVSYGEAVKIRHVNKAE